METISLTDKILNKVIEHPGIHYDELASIFNPTVLYPVLYGLAYDIGTDENPKPSILKTIERPYKLPCWRRGIEKSEFKLNPNLDIEQVLGRLKEVKSYWQLEEITKVNK